MFRHGGHSGIQNGGHTVCQTFQINPLLNSACQNTLVYQISVAQVIWTQDSNVQHFVMVAILEFKMVADTFVRPRGSGNF